MDHFLSLLLLFLFVSFVTLALFFLITHKHTARFAGANLPPGKAGLPFIGETFDFLSSRWKGQPEKFFSDRVARYKSEVFKTSLLAEPTAILYGAAGNRFLFSQENKQVTLWWPKSVDKIFPSSTYTSSNDGAKRLRKILPSFMKPESLQSYVGIMDRIAQWHFAMGWEGKKEVVVAPLTKKYTLCIAYRLFLSVEDPHQIAKFAKLFDTLSSGIFSMPIDLPGTPLNRAKHASKLIRNELRTIINQRKTDMAEGKAEGMQDILSHMLRATDDDGKHTKELIIADRITALLLAGHDTSSAACMFIVNYLADLPEVYDRVCKEQMEIAKSKAPGELLNWDDIHKMNYSWNVTCEVLRLVPPLQGTFREALNDIEFNGFFIPKGWKLFWSTSFTHKNPDYFPEPEKFDPSRFDGSGPEPYTYVPFGGGARMCPGREYARLEILVFMHNLVKRFKWEKLLVDEKIVINPTPKPEKGLPIRLFPHKA